MQQTAFPTVFTIGHSTHTLERFIGLLGLHAITAIADVRSTPYSRLNPQFDREAIIEELGAAGIAYVFLGRELGARSDDPSCYENGRVRYGPMAQTAAFRQGLRRVQEGMKKYRLAMMCAEKEPLECHRTVLVARRLDALGVPVRHILADGRLESQADVLERLVRQLGLPESDMFRSHAEVIEDALVIQESRIAYTSPEMEPAARARRAGQ